MKANQGTRLIPHWKRTLTHGYSAWCVYVAMGVHLASSSLPYVGDKIPWWATIAILGAGLVLRVVKQDSVSAGDDQ